MKFLITLLFSISIAACSSTPKEETETFDWNISDTPIVVVGCEELKETTTNPDC
jgi:uncharacterized lipoprotein YehR (DUF1307 family)